MAAERETALKRVAPCRKDRGSSGMSAVVLYGYQHLGKIHNIIYIYSPKIKLDILSIDFKSKRSSTART